MAQKQVMVDGVEGGDHVQKSQKSDLSSVSHVKYVRQCFDERRLGRMTSAVGGLRLRQQLLFVKILIDLLR